MKVTNIIKDFDRVLHGKSITIMTTLATVIDMRKEERIYDELGYILGLRYLKKKKKGMDKVVASHLIRAELERKGE